MIYLDNTTRKLQAFLAGAAATTNPTVTVMYKDWTPQTDGDGVALISSGKPQFTVLAGATETDICAAPNQGYTREISMVNVFNADTTNVTLTICIDDDGTNRIQLKKVLATLETLCYENGVGWFVLNA